MTQEALKLALEALEDALNKPMWDRPKMTKAITAIEEALREHAMREVQRLGQKIEQEPVKYSDYEPDGVHHNKPPQRTWVGLTDEEIEQIGLSNYIKVVRETEAKLKQLNT